MHDDELHARFAGLRIAIAFAIKAASRTPLDLSHHVTELREIKRLFPSTAHPAAKEELDGIIAALTHMPVKDPGKISHPTGDTHHPSVGVDSQIMPTDLLT